jgi:hypothetical protein
VSTIKQEGVFVSFRETSWEINAIFPEKKLKLKYPRKILATVCYISDNKQTTTLTTKKKGKKV